MSPEFCFFTPRDPKRGPVQSTWSVTSITAVVKAIHDAWALLDTYKYWKSSPFQPVHYDDEHELTTKVAEILNDRLDEAVSGFFRKEYFQVVIRDGKQSTASLDSTKKMPDLAFRLTQTAKGEDREESALFIEAKLIDAQSGCREYVINGLHRFVTGTYAPQMSFGMMLGYCRPNFNDPKVELPIYFANASNAAAKLCEAPVSVNNLGIPMTDHSRAAPAATKFCALHLWVERPATKPTQKTKKSSRKQ